MLKLTVFCMIGAVVSTVISEISNIDLLLNLGGLLFFIALALDIIRRRREVN